MIVTAWNNGAHMRSGAGYGFRVSQADRDEFFKREWASITLDVDERTVEVPVDAERFWSESGHHLSCPEVGKWLHQHGLAPWAMGNPPKFVLIPVQENHFRVEKLAHKEHGGL
jgi:hypothetical protein